MADTASTSSPAPNEYAGHLSVHLEGAHPADVPFLFEQQQKRIGPAVAASLAYHAAIDRAVDFCNPLLARGRDHSGASSRTKPNKNIIWLRQPAPAAAAVAAATR